MHGIFPSSPAASLALSWAGNLEKFCPDDCYYHNKNSWHEQGVTTSETERSDFAKIIILSQVCSSIINIPTYFSNWAMSCLQAMMKWWWTIWKKRKNFNGLSYMDWWWLESAQLDGQICQKCNKLNGNPICFSSVNINNGTQSRYK